MKDDTDDKQDLEVNTSKEASETTGSEEPEGAVQDEVVSEAEAPGDANSAEDEPKAKASTEQKSKHSKGKKHDRAKKKDEPKPAEAPAPKKRAGGVAVPVLVVALIAALVGGALLGHFVWPGAGAGGSLNGKTTLSESELDSVVGTYEYKGESHTITAREAIEQSSSLDSAKNDDGTYTMPTADSVLSIARNEIIEQAAEDEGITVSDDDLESYAEQNIGSSDFDSIASSYGMDVDTVKELIKQSAMMSQLRDKVVDTSTTVDMPDEPTKVSDDDTEDTERKEYADYIITLAGDEWDADKGTWASSDGDYATALADYTVTADKATYGAAETAYYVAYQKYSTEQSEISTQWTAYVNGLLSQATISISNLYA